MAGLQAFREAYMRGYPLDPDDFNDPDARRMRYDVLWAQYDNTAYRDKVHNWANLYKAEYGLYKYARRLLGVPYRLGEFWKAHLWGGALDVMDGKAGDEGALPIIASNDILRPAIAQLWEWSNWPVRKDIVTLNGAVLGDVLLRVVDDVEREKVYIATVHPGTIDALDKDPFGNVKGYTIVETRPHPVTGRDAEYKETAERDGEYVFYRTYLDGEPYAWDGEVAEWAVEYGFVPMVHIKHNDVGLDWGWSELAPALEKIREVDDRLSMLGDQARKTINAKWLFAGVKAPSSGKLSITKTADSTTRPEAGREEEGALYSTDPAAKAQPIVAPLDIAGVIALIAQVMEDIERDYPELNFERVRATGEVSGQALRVARQPAEKKVNQRRELYDKGLVKAHQMAVAIGGWREYEGFEGFNLESYAKGDLDHSIGERPVFQNTEIDKLEEETALWTAAEQAIKAGLPLTVFLRRQGWEDEDIAEVENSPEMQAKRAQMEMATVGLAAMRGEDRE